MTLLRRQCPMCDPSFVCDGTCSGDDLGDCSHRCLSPDRCLSVMKARISALEAMSAETTRVCVLSQQQFSTLRSTARDVVETWMHLQGVGKADDDVLERRICDLEEALGNTGATE